LLEDSILQDEFAWHDYADEYDLAEDEELEAFYFSSAAGRARILLGNRRFGEGGFMSSGRRQARPVPNAASSSSTNRKVKGKGTGKHVRAADVSPVCNEAGPSTSGARGIPNNTSSKNIASSGGGTAGRTPNAHGGRTRQQLSPGLLGTSPHLSGELCMGTSPAQGSGLYGSSPSGSGRRAKRNARRAAADAAALVAASSSSSPLSPTSSNEASGSGISGVAVTVEQAVVSAN
jgi:hypothetical protein